MVDNFHNSSEQALVILNEELERRGRSERFTDRMLIEHRRNGTGPEFIKFGHWIRYPSKEQLVEWLDSRFSSPVRSTRELRELDAR
jgi:hypothetical protein